MQILKVILYPKISYQSETPLKPNDACKGA